MIEKAIRIATKEHFNQKDKAGNPYILHVLRVMSKFLDQEHQIVAVLHDVVEDTDMTFTDLFHEGFGPYIESLRRLTRNKDESYKKYIDEIVDSGDKVALAVKLADLEDNMRFDRNLDPSMYKRYIPAWKKVKEALGKL